MSVVIVTGSAGLTCVVEATFDARRIAALVRIIAPEADDA
jgi:hypothetical protein